jgi:hypothetical protein
MTVAVFEIHRTASVHARGDRERSQTMADNITDRENKDQESGRPVQLDKDKQDKMGQGDKDRQPHQDKPDMEHGQKPGQQHQNR